MDYIQKEKGIIDGFVRISKFAGMREDLVQAGGGNSAVKLSENRMLIKASGYQMADISDNSGYAVVDQSIIIDYFAKMTGTSDNTRMELEENELLQKALIEGKKPSIETFLHSISGVYSLHTHPIVVNAIACRTCWDKELLNLFPDTLLVPYAKPGIELALLYYKKINDYCREKGHSPDRVFLKNHGLMISGDTADMVIDKTQNTVELLEYYLGYRKGGYQALTEVWKCFPDRIVWRVTDQNVLDAYQTFGRIWNTAFCPDCVVFLGKKALKLTQPIEMNSIMAFQTKYGQPVLVEYAGSLYIMADSVRKALEIQSVLSFSAQVAMLNKDVECDYLSDKEQDLLLNWESEKYRKQIR